MIQLKTLLTDIQCKRIFILIWKSKYGYLMDEVVAKHLIIHQITNLESSNISKYHHLCSMSYYTERLSEKNRFQIF